MGAQAQLGSRARPSPRVYLVIPWKDDPAVTGGIVDALASGVVVAALARLPDGDERSLINYTKMLSAPVQDSGAALLVDGHPEIVARAGADGAHISGVDTLETAIGALKPDRIVGVGGVKTRHDAMLAGEAGVDYVMFGEPDKLGHRPSFEAITERVAWWAELFVVPCVAYAASFLEVETLCAAGADFIAVEDLIFSDPRGARAAADDLKLRLDRTEMAE